MKSEFHFMKTLRPVVFIFSLFPLLWLILQALTAGLGANPVEKILHHMGDWALNFLMITLAVSPFQRLTGLTWPLQLRRIIGLFSFFYATLHFITYVAIDQFFAWDAIIGDVIKHKRIIVGFASYILLVLLAITSTNRMVQRMGFKQWQAMHRLVYAAAIGGVIHFLWLVKIDIRRPLIYAGILVLLLGFRAVDRLKRDRNSKEINRVKT